MRVILETSPIPIMGVAAVAIMSGISFMIPLGVAMAGGGESSAKDKTRTGDLALAGVAVVIIFATLITVFFYGRGKMDSLEVAYAEQHGITEMDAQTIRWGKLSAMDCLEHHGQASVPYEWTEASGLRQSGLLKKDFAYDGECEYTLIAAE